MKRIICTIMILAIILLVSISASANRAAVTSETLPIDVINRYSTNQDIQYSIVGQKSMLGFSGESEYTMYELSPWGYAILLNSTNGLMEACYSENAVAPVDVAATESYYYGGPGIYCVMQGGSLINVVDGSCLTEDMILATLQAEANAKTYEVSRARYEISAKDTANTKMTTETTSTVLTHSVQYTYFSNLSEFGTNREDTCTVLAIAMLLGYYDTYVNDYFVDSVYEDDGGTTESFHQLLNDYVYGNSSHEAIYIRKATQGINNYLHDQVLSCQLGAEYSSQHNAISKIIAVLQGGEPVVASMGRRLNALYDHSVLVYKVMYDASNPTGTAVFTMHMGWHSDTAGGQPTEEFVASAGWFYECGYIINNCTSHLLTAWRDYDGTYHCRNCETCTYYELGLHGDSWNSVLGKCTLCGRRGFFQPSLPIG